MTPREQLRESLRLNREQVAKWPAWLRAAINSHGFFPDVHRAIDRSPFGPRPPRPTECGQPFPDPDSHASCFMPERHQCLHESDSGVWSRRYDDICEPERSSEHDWLKHREEP